MATFESSMLAILNDAFSIPRDDMIAEYLSSARPLQLMKLSNSMLRSASGRPVFFSEKSNSISALLIKPMSVESIPPLKLK